MTSNTELDWTVEGDGTGGQSFTIANAIWRFSDATIRQYFPDLQELFQFDRAYFFQVHFDDAWFAVRVYPRRDGGVIIGPKMDDADVALLKGRITQDRFSATDLLSLLGTDWLAEDRITYVGPHKEGKVSWTDISTYVLAWLNEIVLPKALERNRARILRAIPEPPTLDISAIAKAIWVLECDTDMIQGTAFALDAIGLVTCAHVLGKNTHAFRFDDPRRKFETKIVRSHDIIDLAVIEIQTAMTGLTKGDPTLLKQLDHLLIAGHPNYRLGDSPFITPGLLIGWRMQSGIRRIVTNAPIVRGVSGGPVLDRSGMVIGVAVTGAERYSSAHDTEDHSVVPIDALNLLT
jgi:hypothetical protein